LWVQDLVSRRFPERYAKQIRWAKSLEKELVCRYLGEKVVTGDTAEDLDPVIFSISPGEGAL
jgi:hypothetical protein